MRSHLRISLLALLAFGVCLSVASPLQAQQEVRLSRNLDRKLRRDAARLALRLSDGEDLRYQRIEIPKPDMEAIYTALLGLYNADEGIRSIFRCNVHTRPDPSIDHMLIIFDREVEWAAPLQEGRHETTSLTFNDLLYEHDLIIEKHVQWDDTHDAIAIRSNRPLNMASLANEFYNLEGVREIDLGLSKDFGNNISATRLASAWRIEFALSFGAMGQGSDKVHTWSYEINDVGDVRKIAEGGEPVPEWMRCATDGLPMLARG